MITQPIFRPSLEVEVVEPVGVVLLWERGHTVLKGSLHCKLAPLIDGRRRTDDIVEELAPEAQPAHVYYALGLLEKHGYIVESSDAKPSQPGVFWDILLPGTAVESRLNGATVAVERFGVCSTTPLEDALDAVGVRVGQPADFTAVVVDDYLDKQLAAFNAGALASGRPWLLAKPGGTVLWIGPLFRPGQTGCWECLAHRLRQNREVEGFVQRRRGSAAPVIPPHGALAFTPTIASHLAALEVAKAVAGRGPAEAAVTTLDLFTLETQRHLLTRRPQCPVCGTQAPASGSEPATLLLQRRRRFAVDGGYRTITPEETLARYGHLVSPITGATPRLVRVPIDTDGKLHVYVAGRNRALAHGNPEALAGGWRADGSGKGTTDVQARASALGEALERASGVFQGDEPRRRASYRDLGDAAIHPNACMLYSAAQYRDRERWNSTGSGFQRVAEPFNETLETDWTPVWSLTRRAWRYLPTMHCFYEYDGPGKDMCWADSNGNAAGNTLEEAIVQGFLELVERDCVALWWYNRVPRPGVELDTFALPQIDELRAAYRSMGREVWALDLTNDLGIPAFAALSRRVDGGRDEVVFGFAAHFDAAVAVKRALTEMNQFLVWLISRDGKPSPAMSELEIKCWIETATLANQPYLAPSGPPRSRHDYATPQSDDILDDVHRCQEIAERHGMEMLVLDQTRPDFELPVAKVIVPGLRHFWARFAPGRLYDVPVKLGWLPQPLAEEDLNPIAMFF